MELTSSPRIPNSKRPKLNKYNIEGIRHHCPEGVIKEILVRLPVKSILRFKSVCKSWYSLIRSRFFINFHHSHRLLHDDDSRDKLFFSWLGKLCFRVFTRDSTFFYPLGPPSPTPLFDVGIILEALKVSTIDEILQMIAILTFPRPRCIFTEMLAPDIKVLGPLKNGIFCVSAQVIVMAESSLAYGYTNFALCNPATREFKLISPPFFADWTTCRHHFGFCSIQKAGDPVVVVDYKIVAMENSYNQDLPSIVFLYSLRSGSWKQICWKALAALVQNEKAKSPIITQDFRLPQAFLNGRCHWLAEPSVLHLDMTTEVFGLIAGPPKDYFNRPIVQRIRRGVFVFNDHLFAIFVTFEPVSDLINHHIEVWMMMEYGVAKSWTKILSCMVDYRDMLAEFLGMYTSKESHGTSISIDKLFFKNLEGTIVSYDCSIDVIRKCSPPYDNSWACWKTIGLSSYSETLEPVALQDNVDP